MNKRHIVYTTDDHPAPLILTLNANYDESIKFFDFFITTNEIISAVLFSSNGEFITTYNG